MADERRQFYPVRSDGNGERLRLRVYLAFSDESGKGDERTDPFVLVAAAVINPDTQWDNVQGEIDRLIKDNVSPSLQANYEIHAQRLFGQLDRPNYKKLLTGILQIPFKFHLPVAAAAVHRDGMRRAVRATTLIKQPTEKELLQLAQGLAFYLCAQRVETGFWTYIPMNGFCGLPIRPMPQRQ